MIYVIDHKDSFTHNVVHQFSLFDDVACYDFSKINKSKLTQASTIVFSPGPGSPKDYPLTSKIYKKFKGKKRIFGGKSKIHIVVNTPWSPQRSLNLISLRSLSW